MSLNSAATPEGLEIGRAQALQAEAAGIPPSVHMNPILIKPAGDGSSQVIVRGRIWAQLSASDYYQRRVTELLPLVRESYQRLAAEHDLIVLEGAGSPAEINLKQNDIVNMRIAAMANARCILVGDIDRGGVFASLLGTLELLEPEERSRIGGFVINKFRGDQQLLAPGIEAIEHRIAKPCLGVVSYLPSLNLDEEDSLGLPTIEVDDPWPGGAAAPERQLRVAVLALPSIANFTDLDSLRSEPSVDLRLCRTASSLANADMVLLPGSKQTVKDLLWLRDQKIDVAIRAHAARSLVVGICGGMQMLGREISDPFGIEYEGALEGLGLLPIRTTMQSEKTTVLASGTLSTHVLFGQRISPLDVRGYEIHVGETTYLEQGTHLATLASGKQDGCIDVSTRIVGSYLHGIFDDDTFRHTLVRAARAFHRLSPPTRLNNWKQLRDASLDSLASHVERSLNMTEIFRWAGIEYHSRPQASEPAPASNYAASQEFA
jgi:adenosylcobyric acid synthase